MMKSLGDKTVGQFLLQLIVQHLVDLKKVNLQENTRKKKKSVIKLFVDHSGVEFVYNQ